MFDLTRQEYEEIKSKLILNDEMSKIFEMKIKGCSIVEMSIKLNISESTVSRRVKKLKKMILKVIWQ